MINNFTIITDENILNFKDKYYSSGKEIKVGDKIIFGFTINYANVYGKQPTELTKYDLETLSLTLNSFVLPKEENLIYQLYKIKQ